MKKISLLILPLLLLSGCAEERIKVTIENDLPFDRSSETIEIPFSDITGKLGDTDPAGLVVTNRKGGLVTSQLIYNGETDPQYLVTPSHHN